MFRGVIGQETRDWIISNNAFIKGRDVMVGCSGAFSYETCLSQLPEPVASIRSSDVSLYSSALGAYYANQPFSLSAKPEYKWLEKYLTSTESIAAAVVVAQEMNLFRSRKTAFHRRMWDHWASNFDQYHRQVLPRLRHRREVMKIAEYRECDVKDIVSQCPNDTLFMSAPPFFAGAYNNIFAVLGQVFEWEGPSFEVLTDERMDAMLRAMASRLQFIYLSDTVREWLPMVGAIYGGRRVPTYIYSNVPGVGSELYWSMAVTKWRRPPYDILKVDQVLSKPYHLKIVILDDDHFAYIRDDGLSKKITPTNPAWGYGVFVNDVLVGSVSPAE